MRKINAYCNHKKTLSRELLHNLQRFAFIVVFFSSSLYTFVFHIQVYIQHIYLDHVYTLGKYNLWFIFSFQLLLLFHFVRLLYCRWLDLYLSLPFIRVSFWFVLLPISFPENVADYLCCILLILSRAPFSILPTIVSHRYNSQYTTPPLSCFVYVFSQQTYTK